MDQMNAFQMFFRNNNNFQFIDFLKNKVIDFQVVDKEGCNLFHLASKNERVSFEMLKFLLEKKCDLNLKEKELGNTPLHFFSSNFEKKYNQKEKELQLFIDNSNINVRNNSENKTFFDLIEEKSIMKNFLFIFKKVSLTVKFFNSILFTLIKIFVFGLNFIDSRRGEYF